MPDSQTIIAFAALIAAIFALYTYFAKVVHFMDNEKKQDEKIEHLRKHHDEDMQSIKDEQTIIVYGLLACLKASSQPGVDSDKLVKDAIDKIEKHLNKKAHE